MKSSNKIKKNTKKNTKTTKTQKSITSVSKKSNMDSISKNTKENIIENIIDLSMIHKIVKEKLTDIKKLKLDEEIAKLENMELYKEQKHNFLYLKNIIAGVIKNIKKMNKNMVSKKIPEYIPLDYNNLNSCIKAEYNYKNKVVNAGSGAFGDVIKTSGKKYKYAIKVINLDKQDDNHFMNEDFKTTVESLEREAEITRKMGELGIGPKLFDVYSCKVDGRITYYFVLEYMNQGSFYDYIEKNNIKKLPENIITNLITKLKKMHEHGFLHNDLHSGNILVNKRNGKIEFYISDFGLTKNMKEEKIDNLERELKRFKANLMSLFSWKDADKENEIEFISKFILANHKFIL